ncbi:hypothetical protein PHYC_02830 [Phycisphaerales bacterium]|nr:hypothetical protein PHYC_02830 [Phycisphaerales bacterium]
MPIEFRAQFGEDQFVWDLLNRPTRGFFIEVGAFDGYNFSVSYALEAMGWTGLLIEAHPGAFARCQARRTGSRVVHAALGPLGGPATTEFTVVSDQYGGMLSYNATTAEHVRQIAANNQAATKVTVPQTTMDDLLAGHAGGIDVAVLDVEGAEPDLIDGFDLTKHRPRVLIVEDNTRGRNPGLDRAMSKHPYRQAAWVEMNRVYLRADDQELAARVPFL